MKVELMLALREDAQAVIIERLKWDEETDGEYTGPVDNRTYLLLSYMQDFTQRQKLFKSPTIGGDVYTAWSFMFDDSGDILQLVQDQIDYLVAE